MNANYWSFSCSFMPFTHFSNTEDFFLHPFISSSGISLKLCIEGHSFFLKLQHLHPIGPYRWQSMQVAQSLTSWLLWRVKKKKKRKKPLKSYRKAQHPAFANLISLTFCVLETSFWIQHTNRIWPKIKSNFRCLHWSTISSNEQCWWH